MCAFYKCVHLASSVLGHLSIFWRASPPLLIVERLRTGRRGSRVVALEPCCCSQESDDQRRWAARRPGPPRSRAYLPLCAGYISLVEWDDKPPLPPSHSWIGRARACGLGNVYDFSRAIGTFRCHASKERFLSLFTTSHGVDNVRRSLSLE